MYGGLVIVTRRDGGITGSSPGRIPSRPDLCSHTLIRGIYVCKSKIILSDRNAVCIHAWMSRGIDIIMKFEYLISIYLIHLIYNGVRLITRVYSPTSANEILSNLKICFY